MADQSRMAWLDCLRLLAGLSMLILHCTADANGGPWTTYEVSERIVPLIIRTFAYAARTELFIIISLFLLLQSVQNRPRSYFETLSEQARRLLVPFVFWTVFYAGFTTLKAHHFGYLESYLQEISSVETWIKFFLLGASKYHMHFLPTLFCVVLAYPLMIKATQVPALGAVALVFCLIARIQLDGFFYPKFWDHESMAYIARLIKILTHVGYGLFAASCLGLWRRRNSAEFNSWIPVIVYFVALLFSFKFLTTWRVIEGGAWDYNYLPGYWADFLMPACIFLICLLMGLKQWPSIFSRVAKYAFGLYLSHPIVLDLCEIAMADLAWSPWQLVSVKILVAIPLTTALVLLFSRSRAMAWTIGLKAAPSSQKKAIPQRKHAEC